MSVVLWILTVLFILRYVYLAAAETENSFCYHGKGTALEIAENRPIDVLLQLTIVARDL